MMDDSMSREASWRTYANRSGIEPDRFIIHGVHEELEWINDVNKRDDDKMNHSEYIAGMVKNIDMRINKI